MRKALAVIYCPRCGARHELKMVFERLDDGGEKSYDIDNICEKCRTNYTIYATSDNEYLSVTCDDYSGNPYKFIKED